MRFSDEVLIQAIAGDGGNGCLSFLRERARPRGGPDGGDGGAGGDIWLRADERLASLSDFQNGSILRAGNGAGGAGKGRNGAAGRDLELAVPCGTLAYVEDSDELVCDLTENGQRAMVARGGRGGFGNAHFRSSVNRAPRRTTPGEPGDRLRLRLELRLLADIGLLGKPNAGKSTLLAAVTAATPKRADYPFTTLSPQLGVTDAFGDEDRRTVIADIPGLISGAAEGRGLGHRFLRHLMRTGLLLHLVDVSAPNPKEDLEEVSAELSAYSKNLAQKDRWLILSKMDLTALDAVGIVRDLAWKKPWFALSAQTGEGLKALLEAIANRCGSEPQTGSDKAISAETGDAC